MSVEKFFRGNIYIMGFMGCGKSSAGKLLAQHLNWAFLDTDEWIVRETGLSIPEIFETRGELGFRQLERECISRISKLRNYVISLGGGSALDPINWARLSNSGVTVTLEFPAKVIASRLTEDGSRPLLKGLRGKERVLRIKDLLMQRKLFYRKADLVLTFDRDVPSEKVVEDLIDYFTGMS